MPVSKGLAGIEVDNTAVSEVDGIAGQLRYRGYPVESLVDLPFCDVAYLILHAELPTPTRASEFAERLQLQSQVKPEVAQALLAIGAQAQHPMLALQAAIPLLSPASAIASISTDAATLIDCGIGIAAQLPTALAILDAGARGERSVPQVPAIANYGARVLTQLTGQTPSIDAARAFEQVQILQLDHTFNAGTFTARVVASTLAPIQSCIAAAIGALFGKLHGGADQAAIEMAQRIASPAHAAGEIAAMSARGEKIMGMGHREYRVVDPRSLITEQLAERMAVPGHGREELEVLRAIATVCARAFSGKPIHPNLEFYKGVVYLALGLRPELFTPTFSLARVFGYVAHIAECRVDNRIVRPAAHYIGEPLRHVGD